jgi:phenylalanyl-tRNA synthetase alpha chain
MYNDIINLFYSFKNNMLDIKNKYDLERIKINYLGRNGLINKFFKTLNNLNENEKKLLGYKLNKLKNVIEKKINIKILEFKNDSNNLKVDSTISGYDINIGSIHLINTHILLIEDFFSKLGFNIYDNIEIDKIENNFDNLNINLEHPSRNKSDTFYINEKFLLRTHTSNMQIHILKNVKPPIKAFSCGKVYRKDFDSSHTPMFHQGEGFYVDKKISILDLKSLVQYFLEFFFKDQIKYRTRYSYFPFTEPSMEIDIICIYCNGKGCNTCKNAGWIEILGCGMIHPKILKNCNINTNIFNGFAFGIGIERLIMIKYKINDIRCLFENNIEFLKQF